MARIEKRVKLPFPEETKVTLESGIKTSIYRFDLANLLQRHLMSPAFSDVENIDLNLASHVSSGTLFSMEASSPRAQGTGFTSGQ